MQSPVENSTKTKTIGRLLGPALGDQNQGNFSINLWKYAFEDAFKRLCPVRAGGNECGCLPVLARMVCNFSKMFTLKSQYVASSFFFFFFPKSFCWLDK